MVLAFINDKVRTVKQIKFLLNKSVAMPGTFVGMKPTRRIRNAIHLATKPKMVLII